jgi:hypothetical protein
VEEWLSCTDGEFLDLHYDPIGYSENAGSIMHLRRALRRLRSVLRDLPGRSDFEESFGKIP